MFGENCQKIDNPDLWDESPFTCIICKEYFHDLEALLLLECLHAICRPCKYALMKSVYSENIICPICSGQQVRSDFLYASTASKPLGGSIIEAETCRDCNAITLAAAKQLECTKLFLETNQQKQSELSKIYSIIDEMQGDFFMAATNFRCQFDGAVRELIEEFKIRQTAANTVEEVPDIEKTGQVQLDESLETNLSEIKELLKFANESNTTLLGLLEDLLKMNLIFAEPFQRELQAFLTEAAQENQEKPRSNIVSSIEMNKKALDIVIDEMTQTAITNAYASNQRLPVFVQITERNSILKRNEALTRQSQPYTPLAPTWSNDRNPYIWNIPVPLKHTIFQPIMPQQIPMNSPQTISTLTNTQKNIPSLASFYSEQNFIPNLYHNETRWPSFPFPQNFTGAVLDHEGAMSLGVPVSRRKMIYKYKFGSYGSYDGQFAEPAGVAITSHSDIAVADTNNHRIQIFTDRGDFRYKFGESGSHDSDFYPHRISINHNNGDYVITEIRPIPQVEIFDENGQFVRRFGAGVLKKPRAVHVDKVGRIIVVENKVMNVIIFDNWGCLIRKFNCSRYLKFPTGVCSNDRNEILISDNYSNCVKIFSYEGKFIRQIGDELTTNFPIGVAINSIGELIIADNHQLFNLTAFDPTGNCLYALQSNERHVKCYDFALIRDDTMVLASKDHRLYIYPYRNFISNVRK